MVDSVTLVSPPCLLFIVGSLQAGSANGAALDAAAGAVGDDADVTWFELLADVPPFNPDRADEPSLAVDTLRTLVTAADAIVIATPEYAHSLPGVLKNALDWLVGTGELYGKTVALISAGTSGGARALAALDQTLRAQGALVVAQLEIAGIVPKRGPSGEITDRATLAEITNLVRSLLAARPSG
jgi:chromate reductase, NAD(P)H dehydrogenase (quinone)